jgi:cob(I)alamin adenosyltransferase
VTKDDPRIAAIGDVDELNCLIGVLLCNSLPEAIRTCLLDIQHRLFDLGGELSLPGTAIIDDERVSALETELDRLNGELPPLADFILPGGCPAAAHAHVARAVCRRAERHVLGLSTTAEINTASLRYLNRLSDLLFVMARYLNQAAGEPDVLWQHGHDQKPET